METTTSKVDFILQHFGEGDVSRDGTNIAVKCLACGKSESKRKFSIRLDNWRCHCWVCGIKGKNLFGILKEFRGIDHAKDYALKFDIKTDHSESKLTRVRNFIHKQIADLEIYLIQKSKNTLNLSPVFLKQSNCPELPK